MHKNALLSAWIYIRRDKYRENAEKCKSTDKNEKEWVSFAKLDFDSLLAKIIQCNNAKEKNSTLGPNCLIFGQELLKFNDMKRCGSLSNPQSISAPAKIGVALQPRSGWIFGVALRVALRQENRSCAPTSAPTLWSARSGLRSDKSKNYEHTLFYKIWLNCLLLQRSSNNDTTF